MCLFNAAITNHNVFLSNHDLFPYEWLSCELAESNNVFLAVSPHIVGLGIFLFSTYSAAQCLFYSCVF